MDEFEAFFRLIADSSTPEEVDKFMQEEAKEVDELMTLLTQFVKQQTTILNNVLKTQRQVRAIVAVLSREQQQEFVRLFTQFEMEGK